MVLRFATPVLLVALVAGCASGPAPSEEPPTAAATATREPFLSAGTAWAASSSGGCGMCAGSLEVAEHEALFVFESAQVLLVHFGSAAGTPGETTRVSGVEYSEEELRALLAHVPRAQGRAVRVHEVVTARAADADVATDLRAAWRIAPGDEGCADYEASYAVRGPSGAVESQRFVCPVEEGHPLRAFVETLEGLRSSMQG